MRSADAALAAVSAGYIHAFNVLEGVEGDIEAGTSGWRQRGLPWTRG
jgi:rhodanese-related sulfurtransferase